MGRKNRERIARILAGEETPLSIKVKEGMRSAGVSALKATSTSNQIRFLADSLHSGRLSSNKLRKALEDNAHKEMRKGIIKIVATDKIPTVDLLLSEYHKDIEFQKLAAEVGLDEKWFTELAEAECGRRKRKN